MHRAGDNVKALLSRCRNFLQHSRIQNTCCTLCPSVICQNVQITLRYRTPDRLYLSRLFQNIRHRPKIRGINSGGIDSCQRHKLLRPYLPHFQMRIIDRNRTVPEHSSLIGIEKADGKIHKLHMRNLLKQRLVSFSSDQPVTDSVAHLIKLLEKIHADISLRHLLMVDINDFFNNF